MIIHCTKKLLDELKIKPDMDMIEESNPLTSWHANILILNRRKTVVLVNDKNRYVIVLHGLKAKDFKNLDNIIIQSIQNAFEHEGIQNDVIEQFILSSKEFTYTKTKDRKLVARMNRACETLYYFGDLLDPDTIYQPNVGLQLSRDLVGDGKKDYFHPNEALYNDLKELTGIPVFQSKALEMKITLRLQNRKVYRKLIVPTNITFSRLHEVIQTAFGWKDYHLHEFYIFDNKKSNQPYHPNHPLYDGEGYKPIVNLVSVQEAFSYGDEPIPMKIDNAVILSEYMPAKATYIYDFGDSWIHEIKVERVIESYDKNYPVCVDGEGKTPPEDVGGEGGYEVFLEIMADENHPDYESMKAWSKGKGYRDFDIRMVNLRLRNN